MKQELVARPYARALFDIARGHGKEERIAQDLGQVVMVWDGDREFRSFIRRPEISATVKRETVHRVFLELDPITERLIDVVIDKKREDVLATIYEEYRSLWDASRGIQHAEITTASPLSEEQQQALRDALGKVTGTTIHIRVKDDPSLLGGLVIRIGDRILDGSLVRRLAILGDTLRSGDGGGSVVEHKA